MIKLITTSILFFFDYFHKKKIVNFLKNNLNFFSIFILLDIGAHKGDSINFFSKNLKIKKFFI